jgi:TM2 domain-containing membrane protein YozV
MPAIIDSAPDCVVHKEGFDGDDVADFIVNNNYADCAGFMTFGPGSTYGEEGVGATTAYMTLTWLGIVVMVIVFIGWMWYEHVRLTRFAETGVLPAGPTDEPPPSPGQT